APRGRVERGECARLLDACARLVRAVPRAQQRLNRSRAMTRRRDFLTWLGTAAAAAAVDVRELRAEPASASEWDTSWLGSLTEAKYRAVFNATDVSDGVV